MEADFIQSIMAIVLLLTMPSDPFLYKFNSDVAELKELRLHNNITDKEYDVLYESCWNQYVRATKDFIKD